MAMGRGGRLTVHVHDDSSLEALSLARFVTARGAKEVVMLPLLGHTDSNPTIPAKVSSRPVSSSFTNLTAGSTTGYVASAHDLQVTELICLCVSHSLTFPFSSLVHRPPDAPHPPVVTCLRGTSLTPP